MSITTTFLPNNGAIHNTAQILKHVMSLAAEVELGALFINSKLMMQLQHTLVETGHHQTPTQVQTNNLTAYGVVTNKIIPRATEVMDMHFHWLHDQEQQQHFHFYWWPGKTNFTDYETKHHPAIHHKLVTVFFNTSRKNKRPKQHQQKCERWWKMALMHHQNKSVSNCKGVLKSPNSLTPALGNEQMVHKKGNIQMLSHGRTSKLWNHHITKSLVVNFEPATNKNDNID